MAEIEPWRAAYSRRFIERTTIRRPIPYVRPTDEEIAALPESLRRGAIVRRNLNDLLAALAESAGKITRGEPL